MRATIVIAAALAAALPHAAAADSLTGRIVDPQDRVVPQARVRLFDRTSGQVRETVSAPDGSYLFGDIPPGDYLLEGRAAAGSLSGAAAVRVDGSSSSDLALGVSGVTAEVLVTASSTPLLAREVAKALDVIDGQELALRNELSVAEALRTLPGIRVQSLGGPGSFTTVQTRGMRSYDTAVLIDGLRFRDGGESAERRYRLSLEPGHRRHRAHRGHARLGVVALRLERDGRRHQRHVAHGGRPGPGRRPARGRRTRPGPHRAEPARRAGRRPPDLQRRRLVHRRDAGHSRRQPLSQRLAAGDAALPAQPHAVGDGTRLVRRRRSADPQRPGLPCRRAGQLPGRGQGAGGRAPDRPVGALRAGPGVRWRRGDVRAQRQRPGCRAAILVPQRQRRAAAQRRPGRHLPGRLPGRGHRARARQRPARRRLPAVRREQQLLRRPDRPGAGAPRRGAGNVQLLQRRGTSSSASSSSRRRRATSRPSPSIRTATRCTRRIASSCSADGCR